MNFYEKLCVLVTTWSKKHSSNEIVPITYALGREFFSATTFEGLRVFFSGRVKVLVYFGLYESLLHF